MKASGLYGIRDVRMAEIPKPEPKPGEVLIKVMAATTCGTDLKMYHRGYHDLVYHAIPWGHECAGVVEEIGEGVEKFKKGDRIASHNTAPCGYCYFCKKGRSELCQNKSIRIGAYAEYCIIPSRIVEMSAWKIPENIDFAIASVIEPFSCTVW